VPAAGGQGDPARIPEPAAGRAGADLDFLTSRLPPPERWAYFLDLDGTLVDLAPRPDAVSAEAGLEAMLQRLEWRAAGALAIVTGRAVGFVDGLFPNREFVVAGLHGAELRMPRRGHAGPAVPAGAADPPGYAAARANARNGAARVPGLLFEDKGAAFALHYRNAPDAEPIVRRIMDEASAEAGADYRLRPGKYVLELGPAAGDKGAAVRSLMERSPFRGRFPFAAGDDLTDEAMFRAVNAMGGLSVRIGPLSELSGSVATAGVSTAAGFREWMRTLAE